jgi:membrane protease YdiL (CAAX protease family)
LPETRSDRPLSLPAAAFWGIALWLLEHVCFEMTEAARPGAITDIVSLAACVVLATSVVAFAMVRVHAPEASLRATFGIRRVGLLSLLLAAAAGAGLCPVLSTVDDLVARRWPYEDPDALAGMEKLLSSSTALALVLGVFVVIPLAREAFFRGVLFEELRRTSSASVTIATTALLFAVFSTDWRSMPTALVLGAALGWIRFRTRSVVAPAVAHLAFWSVVGVPILRGADPAADIVYPARWIAAGAGIAVLALAAVGAGRGTSGATSGTRE